MDIQGPVEYVENAVQDRAADVYEITRKLLENPEIGYEEMRSSALLRGYLLKQGFKVQMPVAELDTAYVARAGIGGENTVAMILEYDAVPEVGHGCGHNLIAAATAVAGAVARSLMHEMDVAGALLLIGTPAEEGGLGKVRMLEHGVFEDLDAALQFHPDRLWGHDEAQLSAQGIHISFEGKPAHSTSAPWNGINALDAVIQTFNGINALREHLSPDLRISGVIADGGGDIALVPQHAAAHFRIRGYNTEQVKEAVEKLRGCAEAGALATGASLTWSAGPFEPSPVANPALKDLAVECGSPFGVDFATPRRISETTDFGAVSEVVPTLLLRARCWPGGTVSHTEDAARRTLDPMAQEAALQTAKTLALMTVRMLDDPSLAERCWDEHNVRKDDR